MEEEEGTLAHTQSIVVEGRCISLSLFYSLSGILSGYLLTRLLLCVAIRFLSFAEIVRDEF